MKRKAMLTVGAFLSLAFVASAQVTTIPGGTSVPIRTNEYISARSAADGRIYTGVVEQDVLDRDGRVAIPRGANAELIVRQADRRNLVLDLDSVTVEGRRYSVESSDISQRNSRAGVGGNGRTAKYVGGGAILGTIIGAIAGGGKGAAIGALAGGGAGAGTQMLTRGGNVQVPAESVLTFRLERPLVVDVADRGHDRDGHHYHPQDDRR